MKIGITGGIGSGKSYVCRLLHQRGINVYDCDAAAKRLMHESPTLRQQLTELIGPDTYNAPSSSDDTAGHLNKAAVARFLLASEENAKAVDAIVHPAVTADFEQSGYDWIESAILFEAGIDHIVDRIIIVTAPEEVRINRIMQRDGISEERARQWLCRQWPQEEVLRRAHYEIINDGVTPLQPQTDNILRELGLLTTVPDNQK